MDKELIRRRFMRGRRTYDSQAEAQCRIAGKMAGLIARYVPRSSQRKVVEVGCGTGVFTRQLLRVAQPDSLWLNDLCPEMQDCLADILGEKVSFHPGDAERLLFPSGQGLIASCSAVQWFVSPELFFISRSRPWYVFAVGYAGRQRRSNFSWLISLTVAWMNCIPNWFGFIRK